MTVKEAAEELGLSASSIVAMIRADKLQATITRAFCYHIEPEDLDAVRDRRPPGRPAKPKEKRKPGRPYLVKPVDTAS